jgi:aspartyl-tRNA synthetase
VKWNEDRTFKSSISKFYSEKQLLSWAESFNASPGDMFLIMSGDAKNTRKQLSELRLEMARRSELIDREIVKPLWVIDFPLLEWDDETERFHAMHHPFTSPIKADVDKMVSEDREVLKALRANAYDLVINGSEIGGGSIRIHDRSLQEKNFELLGFSEKEAVRQFGFLMSAFEYGAPPHGGIAFGFDRLCAVMQGYISIRDYIAFPKNNMGRDVMIDAPSEVSDDQLKELGLSLISSSSISRFP